MNLKDIANEWVNKSEQLLGVKESDELTEDQLGELPEIDDVVDHLTENEGEDEPETDK